MYAAYRLAHFTVQKPSICICKIYHVSNGIGSIRSSSRQQAWKHYYYCYWISTNPQTYAVLHFRYLSIDKSGGPPARSPDFYDFGTHVLNVASLTRDDLPRLRLYSPWIAFSPAHIHYYVRINTYIVAVRVHEPFDLLAVVP